ncbi:MAG: response regulator, partial [Geminicoccaceae bacterium]
FRQLDYRDSVHDRGHGLGLAIVKRILTLLDHPIELSSTIDHGSRFSIAVPLGSKAKARTPQSPPCEDREAMARMTGTVVVIENEEAIRAGMMALLENWGYQVLTASDADEVMMALRKLSLSPDLIIADYHLDLGRLGTDAIERLRSISEAPIPAMIITADRSPEVQDAVAEHDLPLLTKPIKPARLRTLMTYLMSAWGDR